MTQQQNGTIKYVNPSKGFGFITPAIKGTPDVFFSFDQMRGNAARTPSKGESVVYEQGTGKRGPIATTLYVLADPLAAEDLERDTEAAARYEAQKKDIQAARKAFTESLYEKNRLWRERAAANAAAKKAQS